MAAEADGVIHGLKIEQMNALKYITTKSYGVKGSSMVCYFKEDMAHRYYYMQMTQC